MTNNDATLAALALLELVGRPVGPDTAAEVDAILGDRPLRVTLELAGMVRSILEAHGTPVQAWINDYRQRELGDTGSLGT